MPGVIAHENRRHDTGGQKVAVLSRLRIEPRGKAIGCLLHLAYRDVVMSYGVKRALETREPWTRKPCIARVQLGKLVT